jgi:hypothetical protein
MIRLMMAALMLLGAPAAPLFIGGSVAAAQEQSPTPPPQSPMPRPRRDCHDEPVTS